MFESFNIISFDSFIVIFLVFNLILIFVGMIDSFVV